MKTTTNIIYPMKHKTHEQNLTPVNQSTKQGDLRLPLRHFSRRLSRRGLVVGAMLIATLAISTSVHAQCQQGCDAATGNTFLGEQVLLNNTTGLNNTGVGAFSLDSNTSGTHNTAVGFEALFYNDTGSSNTACGADALVSNNNGTANSAVGQSALADNVSGSYNTAVGGGAMSQNAAGYYNSATGNSALANNFIGSNNTANGYQALVNNTTGSNNVALGWNAGTAVTTGSYNIDIGNVGAGESSTIRIGTPGAPAGQTATYVAGIFGAAIGSGPVVHISNQGKLGTTPSSARFKEAIKPMDKASNVILALQPVTFCYKKEYDPEKTPQFGLVAEEVEKVDPELIYHDQGGRPYSVRYEAINAMLLNEFLKEHREVEDLEKGMAVLTAQLKEQAAQIQKVSAQLEASKPAPQVVNNP